MPNITDIANVVITRQTVPATRSSFGTLLIPGEAGVLPGKDVVVLTFDSQLVASNSIAGNVDGAAITPVVWNTSHDLTVADLVTELLLAAGIGACVASDVGAVGYDNTVTCTATNVDTVLQLTDFIITLGASQPVIAIVRTPFRRTQSYTSLAGMVADGFSTTDLEYIAASAFFGNRNPGSLKIGRKDSAPDWDDELDDLIVIDNDWYALAITSKTIADVTMVMDWLNVQRTADNKKRFMASSNDVNNLVAAATSDIGYHANNEDYDGSSVAFLEDADLTYPECARWADELSRDPGTYTAKFKQTSQFTASPSLSDTQRTGGLGKGVNLYETYGARDMWHEGTMGSGEFEDIIRGIDWLENEMEINIFNALSQAAKVPYTDGGIGIVEAEVRGMLDEGIRVGLLRESPDDYDNLPYLVTRKAVADIDAGDIGARNLPADAITWEAKVAGAIHNAAISGIVAV